MKQYLTILFCIIILNVFSGDTTKIRVHDATDMTWYGNYDEWGLFPDGSETYRKIYLHYTMGCATNGCSDWDYTTKIEVLHRTGDLDSNLQTSPNFMVNGNVMDTVFYSDTTYIHFWDSINNVVDSSLSSLIEIIYFNDPNNPTQPTDTNYVFHSGFYNMIYDTNGLILDSIYVYPENVDYLSYYNWYTYFDVIEAFELARVITPYGSGLTNDWKFTHIFDITDFALILKDSVEIRAHYSGWSSGFSVSLDFEFIEGSPPRHVNSLQNIYSRSCNYNNSSSFESNCLHPKKFYIDQNSSGGMIKMTTSGHGFDNNINAAEFKEIDYFVRVDGLLTHIQNNWDDECGVNPIYPQGGTWLYDRANWCPGLRAKAFDHEITDYLNPLDSIEINIDFDNYIWSGSQTPSYIIDCQLFLYSDPNFSNDVEIVDIIKPSLKDEYSRMNPICGKPLIKIRNYGKDPLSSVDIEYGVLGGTTHTYKWTGSLLFLQEEEVELPALSGWQGSKNVFEVKLSKPNGLADEYLDNNNMLSEFQHAPTYQNIFAVWTQTNLVNETSWKFYDIEDSEYASSNPFMQTNTQYRDTIAFDNGCYTFLAVDSDEDGLDFWANNDGSGYIRFRNTPGTWFTDFNPDFGTEIRHNFIAGSYVSPLSTSNIHEFTFEIFPNPTKGSVFIKGNTNNYKIKCYNVMGEIVYEEFMDSKNSIEEIDLHHLPQGVYFIHASNHQVNFVKKILIE
ncbi:MAG: hypothetical protein CMP51_01810 [Flavobacteriales bacterium]|nr:hypothetical protein [Flavobacteriales bacterium]